MAKRFYKYFPWLFITGDLFIIGIALLLTQFVGMGGGPEKALIWPFYLAYWTVWFLVALRREDYKIGRTSGYDHTLERFLGSFMWFLFFISLLWISFQDHQLDRSFLFVSVFLSLVLLGMYRVAVHLSIRKYRIKGKNYRNAVIIGKGENSQKLARLFQARKDYGIHFLGFFDKVANDLSMNGDIQAFYKMADSLALDLVYLHEKLGAKTIQEIIDFADENYIKVKIIPSNNLPFEKSLSFSKYGDFFVINVNEVPLDQYFNRYLKRSFDILFAAFVTLFILSWMIPLVGLLIKLESKGPVFFIQERNGENNRVFKCLKFRSMTPNDYADVEQARKNDPRVTKIGKFLRAHSLDEMPQFLNVLIGDMSIVGPRPHTVPMNRVFKNQMDKYNSRHKIKPGITGLAQVKGYRGEIERPFQIRSRVKLDYFYIKNWSFWMDLRIIFKTFLELVFNPQNAY